MLTAGKLFVPVRGRLGIAVTAGTLVISALAGAAVVALSSSHQRVPAPQPPSQAASAAIPSGTSSTTAGARYVYLTFDDGPHPTYTAQILSVLDRYGVRATFFQIGREVRLHGALSYQAHRRGHSVQNHTWSHVDLRRQSWSGFRQQVVDADRFIRARTGQTPRCLRPPFGAVDRQVYRRAAGLNKSVQLWTVDPRDWQRPGASVIANRVLSRVRTGSVILLHDGGGNRSQTVAATSTIIRTLKARGYTFRTMCR